MVASDNGRFGSRVCRKRLGEREKPGSMLNALPASDDQPSPGVVRLTVFLTMRVSAG